MPYLRHLAITYKVCHTYVTWRLHMRYAIPTSPGKLRDSLFFCAFFPEAGISFLSARSRASGLCTAFVTSLCKRLFQGLLFEEPRDDHQIKTVFINLAGNAEFVCKELRVVGERANNTDFVKMVSLRRVRIVCCPDSLDSYHHHRRSAEPHSVKVETPLPSSLTKTRRNDVQVLHEGLAVHN